MVRVVPVPAETNGNGSATGSTRTGGRQSGIGQSFDQRVCLAYVVNDDNECRHRPGDDIRFGSHLGDEPNKWIKKSNRADSGIINIIICDAGDTKFRNALCNDYNDA